MGIWLSKSPTVCEFGSQNYLRKRIWPSNILTGRAFFLNICCPDNYSLSEILNTFKTSVRPCSLPGYNVPALGSSMSLSPYIVQAGEERNSPRLNLALMVHGVHCAHIM